MYTSVMLFALSGLVGAAEDAAPGWKNDYFSAQKQGMAESKPLAIFLAPGENGWDKLSKEKGLDKEVKQLLAGKYIPVFINTDSEEGKKLAKAFEMTANTGIVLSDKSGKLQAFWHEGDLANGQMVGYLQRFSNPDMVVSTTETNPSNRTSYYGPGGKGAQQGSYPSNFCPSCSSCPGGNCYRR